MASNMVYTYDNHIYSNDPETCDDPIEYKQCGDQNEGEVYEAVSCRQDRDEGDHIYRVSDSRDTGKSCLNCSIILFSCYFQASLEIFYPVSDSSITYYFSGFCWRKSDSTPSKRLQRGCPTKIKYSMQRKVSVYLPWMSNVFDGRPDSSNWLPREWAN